MTYFVTAAWLNVRSEPKLQNDNKIVAIPYGHPVQVVSVFDHRWSAVTTNYSNQEISGFSASRFLSSENGSLPPQDFTEIAPVHRRENLPNSSPNSRRHWSYPIGDPNRKTRDVSTTASKVASVLEIIDYLNVETSERYRPAKYTYCNIYAHDYVYLCGAYLPRCWWNEKALLALSRGESVFPHYGTTIYELNANSLYFWLKDWGPQFGWKQYFDLEEVQQLANEGKICLCSAHNRQSNRSGHICCIIPAHEDRKGIMIDGKYAPLMSQAGRHNRKFFNNRWWTSSRFNFFGFWVHE